MKKVNWFAIGLASLFVPSLGYIIMGNYAKAVILLCVVVAAWASGSGMLLMLIMPFSALMQLNQAFVHNRAINDSKTEEMLYELRKANRIRETDSN
jgi:hypothetical protein